MLASASWHPLLPLKSVIPINWLFLEFPSIQFRQCPSDVDMIADMTADPHLTIKVLINLLEEAAKMIQYIYNLSSSSLFTPVSPTTPLSV
jgi:hypothetical protein